LYILKVKLLAVSLFVVFAIVLTIPVTVAQTSTVTGTISESSTEIITHGSVTLTCTYTSTTNPTGTGKLWMFGPVDDPTDTDTLDISHPTVLQYYDNTVKTLHSPELHSGVPVTFTKTIDTPGYYKFRWDCQSGSVIGAYVEVILHVVDVPTVLPEAPPLAVFALGFAALGLFAAVTKKRAKQSPIQFSQV
jgi:hypothetical protein